MHTVQEILREKGDRVWTIGPQETVLEGLRAMAEHSVGALVVTERKEVVGILSERDYARKIILLGRTSAGTTVGEIMSSPVISAAPDWDVEDCMRVMTENRIRHLPVLERGELRGIVSIGDVVKAQRDKYRGEVETLETQILSDAP